MDIATILGLVVGIGSVLVVVPHGRRAPFGPDTATGHDTRYFRDVWRGNRHYLR